MSWKSLVSAGLLCVVASPVFAAPAISVAGGGTQSSNLLNNAGLLVWNTQISNSNPVPSGSSPLAAELGFTSSGALVSATNLSTLNSGTGFDKSNPGTQIFGWETPGTGTNGKPEGLQTNLGNRQVFAALGSQDFNTVGPHDFVSIVTAKPSVTLATPNGSQTLTVSGAYGGKGRIAELTSGTAAANYDTYNNVFTRNYRGGDSDLNGQVNFADFQNALVLNYGQTGKAWYQGDFDGNGTVEFADFQILATQFGTSYTVSPGAGSGSAVPEPASLAILGLGLLSGVGLIRRKR